MSSPDDAARKKDERVAAASRLDPQMEAIRNGDYLNVPITLANSREALLEGGVGISAEEKQLLGAAWDSLPADLQEAYLAYQVAEGRQMDELETLLARLPVFKQVTSFRARRVPFSNTWERVMVASGGQRAILEAIGRKRIEYLRDRMEAQLDPDVVAKRDEALDRMAAHIRDALERRPELRQRLTVDKEKPKSALEKLWDGVLGTAVKGLMKGSIGTLVRSAINSPERLRKMFASFRRIQEKNGVRVELTQQKDGGTVRAQYPSERRATAAAEALRKEGFTPSVRGARLQVSYPEFNRGVRAFAALNRVRAG